MSETFIDNNNNNNFICIAVYTKAVYRFTIKLTNNSTKTKSQLKASLKR